MKSKKNNKKKGFTLIEILVVVLIIGVLAAIAMPAYMRSMERSKAASPMANLSAIAKAQKVYSVGTDHYTNNIGNLDISLKDTSNGENATGSTFETENFVYNIYGDDKAVATATRKDVSEDKQYELSIDYNTNIIYCRPIENKTCIDLGLEEGQDYSSSAGVPCTNGVADAIAGEGFEDYVSSLSGSCSVNNGVLNYFYCEDEVNNICSEGVIENGLQKTTNCYYGGCSYLEYDLINNFEYLNYWCTDSSCSSYSLMREYQPDEQWGHLERRCLEINGLECMSWGEWSIPK